MKKASIFSELIEVLAIGFTLFLALLLPVAVGEESLTIRTGLAILIISTLAVTFGKVIYFWLRTPAVEGFITAFQVVIGFAALSLTHLAFTTTLKVDARHAFIVDVFAVLLACLLSKGMWTTRDTKPPAHAILIKPIISDLGVLLMASALATLWTREAIASVAIAKKSGIFHAWIDFFLHAEEITYLRDYRQFGGHCLFLADSQQFLYHRAGYALSALFSWLSKVTALKSATLFMMPTGIILCSYAAYGLGSVLRGRKAGFASMAALLMLPDASMYGLRNGFFGYHWLMQISPTSGYAIAIVLIALGIYVLGVSNINFRLVLIAVALAITAGAFRVHVTILASLLFSVLLFIAWQPKKSWHRFAVILFVVVSAIPTIMLFETIPLAPHFLSGKPQAIPFFEAIHNLKPSAYEGIYNQWTAHSSAFGKIGLGYLLFLLGTLGAILPFVCLICGFHCTKTGWKINSIPLILLAVYLLLIIFIPAAAHGDITDYPHRPFVLVYAVFITFLMSLITPIIVKFCVDIRIKKQILCFSVFSLLTLLVAVPWQYGFNRQQGNLGWSQTFTSQPITSDMFRSTRFIRQHALPDERIQSSDEDPLALVVALTEKPALVSREPLYRVMGGELGNLARERLQAHRQLKNLDSFNGLKDFGFKQNVQWYLLNANDMPLWPKTITNNAVFRSGDMMVFYLGRALKLN